jgi:hypothetical protein
MVHFSLAVTTKSGHHCPLSENDTLRSQFSKQNDLLLKLTIFYGYGVQALRDDDPLVYKMRHQLAVLYVG